jgi:hypothetical protein
MSKLQKVWTLVTWIPRGITKSWANEISGFSQVFTTQEALARVAKLESEGKLPLRVARREFLDMWLACWPYRFRNILVEYEILKKKVLSGCDFDRQDIVDLMYMFFWALLLYKFGESIGRGSFYGYRFDGEEHRSEAQRAIEFQKAEAIEGAKAMVIMEKEIAEWIAKMEAENK